MREDQVENGVKFLVHPKVTTAPLSQRISFLENKGLTSEEISVALSRVEGGGGGGGDDGQNSSAFGREAATSSGGGGSSYSHSMNAATPGASQFPAEPEVPLWKKLAVPGALVVGAVGALGAYHAAATSHRSAAQAVSTSSQSNTPLSGGYAGGGGYGATSGTTQGDMLEADGVDNTTENGTLAGADGEYRLDGDMSDVVGSYRINSNGDNHRGDSIAGRTNNRLPGVIGGDNGSAGSAKGDLAEEFRRLSDAMEHQTGQLVEAVGAMKTLASRAEQDSSSLLAARVSSHTSELRAELGTIKQLLLLQAGGGGGGAAVAGGGSAETGGVAANSGSGVAAGAATAGNASTAGSGGGPGSQESSKAKDAAGSAAEGFTAARGVNGHGMIDGSRPEEAGSANGLGTTDERTAEEKETEDKASKEAAATAATAHRKHVARTALSALLAANAPQAAKDGIAMLRMLVANLIKQPNVPRYRRIATSNDNFKKRVLPLEGHRAMMEAIGFRNKGSLWEWTWHEDTGSTASADNKAVLEDIVVAIDAAGRQQNGVAPSTPSPTTRQAASVAGGPLPAFAHSPRTPNGLSSTAPSLRQTNPSFPGNQANTLEQNSGKERPAWTTDFAEGPGTRVGAAGASSGVSAAPSRGGAVKQNSSAASEIAGGAMAGTAVVSNTGLLAAAAEANRAGGAVTGDVTGSDVSRANPEVDFSAASREGDHAGDLGDVTAARVLKEGAVGHGSGGGSSGANVEESAKPPVSMAEVAAAIQRGENPPGIRIVEDRLSADAPAFVMASSRPSPPKPWETTAADRADSATENSGFSSKGVRHGVEGGPVNDTGGRGGVGGEASFAVGDDASAKAQQTSTSSLSSPAAQHAVFVGP